MDTNKYAATVALFDSVESEEIIQEQVNSLLKKRSKALFTTDTLKRIYGCIDLTSLTTLDSKESIWKMVEKVNQFDESVADWNNVAAICVYPLYVETVKQALLVKDVKIASVAAGFPSAQTFTEVKVAETALAVYAGADEIDVVMNLGLFLEEAYEELTDELAEIKSACRDAVMKVILETGALVTPKHIQQATILALYSGADFIKTSTGKGYPGATPEAFYLICQTVKKYYQLTGNRVGVKVAGGVSSAEEAVSYFCIAKEVLGEEWLNSSLFRIGASRLVQDIETRLVIKAEK